MYKSTSKNMQKPKNPFKKGSGKCSSGNSAGETNSRRAKFFWEIKKCLDSKQPLPNNLPLWLTTEFNAFGGAATWVKRNYYWQNKLHEELDSKNARIDYLNQEVEKTKKSKGIFSFIP